MRFSEQFGIRRSPGDDWFDPILTVDTPLFIDPFLVFTQESGMFVGAHIEIIEFFNAIFKIIARSGGKSGSVPYQKAVADLMLPEVEEVCLGYTEEGTKGSGSGRGLAETVAAAIWEAIKAGTAEITHFEELAIIEEGIGADRIGDITAGLLRRRLAAYTQDICKHHGIATNIVNYGRGSYDTEHQSWVPIEVSLPRNPHNGRPILLVPQKYLNDLPTLNPYDFWEFGCSNENEAIRNQFSYDITRHVSKHEIIEIARRHPEIRRAYLSRAEHRPPQPYDFGRDEKGYIGWYDAARAYCLSHPLTLGVPTQAAFLVAVDNMLDGFRHYVQENAGWRLLWNDNGSSKGEKASQLLLLGIMSQYCQANDIDVSPESNIGRGPVDFKVSKGYGLRALIEVKLARNSKFWNGLKKQLPQYLKAEQIAHGYFVVVILSESDLKRTSGIQDVVAQVRKDTGCKLRTIIVDARRDKPSASKL